MNAPDSRLAATLAWPTMLAAALLFLELSPGYAAVPTEVEWQTWPDYCRARFVVAGDGVGSIYELRVPKQEVTRWQQQMGQAWDPLHHYCYGLLFTNRAKLEDDPAVKTHLFGNAVSEFTFSYRGVEDSSAFFAEYASKLATALQSAGDLENARRVADEMIIRQPHSSSGYLVKAILLRDLRELHAAAETLEQGLQAVGEHAADLHYTLGLILLDLNDIERAAAHAERAYAGGYPLPGLRNRLRRAGVNLPTAAVPQAAN